MTKVLCKKLSLIVPAHNEESIIYNNSLEMCRLLNSFVNEFEIIIVDDGSEDSTYDEAMKASKADKHIKVLKTKWGGKGNALKNGTVLAIGDYIAFCDADLDISPIQLKYFFDVMINEKSDVVIGSKMHKDSIVDYPFIRKVYSYCYYILLCILFNLKLKDTQTGLKLFKASIIKEVMSKVETKGFAFDIEMLTLINDEGYKISSAPVEIVFHRKALGRIGVNEIYNMIVDTFKIFYKLRIKKEGNV